MFKRTRRDFLKHSSAAGALATRGTLFKPHMTAAIEDPLTGRRQLVEPDVLGGRRLGRGRGGRGRAGRGRRVGGLGRRLRSLRRRFGGSGRRVVRLGRGRLGGRRRVVGRATRDHDRAEHRDRRAEHDRKWQRPALVLGHQKQVDEDKFRGDLFYRLNVVNIEIPPIRERIDDIPLLVNHFLKKINN